MRTVGVCSLTTLALLLAGCSGPSDDRPATALSSPQVSPSTPSSGPTTCPNPHGGTCRGDLPAGQYRTSTFHPAVTYTVPAGWTNAEDLPGNVLLYQQDDPQDGTLGGSYVGIYQDVWAAAIDCAESPQPDVGSRPADLVAWYRSVPGLIVSLPKAVTVGGLSGTQIDLALKPNDDTCQFDGLSGVPLTIGSGASQLHHVLLDGLEVRLLILDWNGTNVVVEITNVRQQHQGGPYRTEVQPIIGSLTFQS
jgi:hypothetical protein